MDIKQKFGFKVKTERKMQGYSQEKFALKAGVDRAYMHQIETGKTNVSLEIIEKISVALNIKISNLFE